MCSCLYHFSLCLGSLRLTFNVSASAAGAGESSQSIIHRRTYLLSVSLTSRYKVCSFVSGNVPGVTPIEAVEQWTQVHTQCSSRSPQTVWHRPDWWNTNFRFAWQVLYKNTLVAASYRVRSLHKSRTAVRYHVHDTPPTVLQRTKPDNLLIESASARHTVYSIP